MAYHGEDLDLRTQQTWTPADGMFAAETSPANGKRGHLQAGPVLVDDAVLASFNQAYDIASAHRAGEVRIEHLLNAMTRVDPAAAALEAHGIRVVALKRETATIIAGDIPAVSGPGAVSPRRSDELAELLRLASSAAARRNSAIAVDDLLHVLLDQRSDFPQSELLMRFSARFSQMPEPLPPLTRADGRYPPSPLRYSGEYARAGYRNDYLGMPADALQNSRIDALEQSVRALRHELANDRHIIAGLIRDLSRDTLGYQDEQARGHTVLIERIGALEATLREGGGDPAQNLPLLGKLEAIDNAVQVRLQEISQNWALLSTRLQDLESAIANPRAPEAVIDLKPIAERLEMIEEAVLGSDNRGQAEIADGLLKLEAAVSGVLVQAKEAQDPEALLGGLDKIDSVSNKLDTHNSALTELAVALVERMNAVEHAVEAEIETAAAKHQAYTQDLTEVHEALLKVNENQHTLAGSMDQWRTESAADVASILNRLETIDRDAALPAETLAALNDHMESTNRFIIERYSRRRRFWHWLFGTDDWIAASWPSAKAALPREDRPLKEAGA
ncbi:Clp protease N-terminal domain-containing protein [Hyphomicrobium sp.]|uniref:Clp protease N-terminal domain-containing protein n=1 Tax=Hyphomicrobium sp. TaxID=82 RepID=UPI002D799932|nr:Clp protease N-terminal domain-containing protein [Hyphomicrobium sp.]HET6389153.1 Clp protease N-terminal domain-containing protein [Hyphomicrobium sp.]